MYRRLTVSDVLYWFTKDGIPFTKGIVAFTVLTFFFSLLGGERAVYSTLAFNSPLLMLKPWTILTYPLLITDPFSLIFAGYWMWVAGGTLERTWHTRKFAIFFLVVSAVSALGVFFASLITRDAVVLAGLWVPLAAVTVAFGMLNPEQVILFMLIIPMKLKYLAMISAGLLFAAFARTNLVTGVFSLTGCAVAYCYVRYELNNRLSAWYQDNVVRINPRSYRRKGLLGWFREWREQKRLRDFLRK
jgi:membrane associated rhomboid family serine protease